MRRSLLYSLSSLLIVFVSASAQSGRGFSDEFNDTRLDAAKWDVFHLPPTVADGKLVLAGSADKRSEIQSKQSFLYGVLTVAIESASWKSQAGNTDASFGVEIFGGANRQCHYSAVLKANGHLGLLRPEPDANNNCAGDPANQEPLPLPNAGPT